MELFLLKCIMRLSSPQQLKEGILPFGTAFALGMLPTLAVHLVLGHSHSVSRSIIYEMSQTLSLSETQPGTTT